MYKKVQTCFWKIIVDCTCPYCRMIHLNLWFRIVLHMSSCNHQWCIKTNVWFCTFIS